MRCAVRTDRSLRTATFVAPAVLAAVVLAAALVGCRGGARPALVFSVGGAPGELRVWEDIVRDFGAETGVAVELLRLPADTSQQRQSLLVALDTAQPNPDVFLMDVAWIGLFAEAGWLRPLDAPPDGIDPAPFFQRVLDTVDRHDGALVALPVYMDGGVLYYRTDLLARYGFAGPPTTWRELQEQARVVQAGERGRRGGARRGFWGFVWQGAQYEGLVVNFLEFAGTAGGLVQRGGGLVVDTPENRRALAFMRGLVGENGVSPPSTFTEMREEEVRAAFQRGDALFERNWPYAWALHQQEGSPVRGRVGVAALPAPESGRAVSTLGGWHIGVSRFSDAPDDALRFVRHVTSRRIQASMVRRLGWSPGRRDLYDDPDVLATAPVLAELAAAFRNARPRPPLAWYSQASDVLQRWLNAALAGDVSPAAALRGAQAGLDALAGRYAPDATPAPAGEAAGEEAPR